MAYIVGHHQIAEVTRAVPKHCKAIPKTFSPEFRSYEPMYPWNQSRNAENSKENKFVLCRSPLKPRRDHGDNQIDADKRIHEPKMSRHGREIERQHLQIGNGLFPTHSTPRKRKESIKKHEGNHRREDA